MLEYWQCDILNEGKASFYKLTKSHLCLFSNSSEAIMSVSTIFSNFLDNLKIDNAATISSRYGEITSSLNDFFRESDSTTANSLQVGSYGRYTGIKGISDLDMLYIVPDSKWDDYKENQYNLLSDTKTAILQRYPRTKVSVDRLVVSVKFSDFVIEVQPVFKITNGEEVYYKYPDTYNGGSWKETKPLHEIKAMKEFVEQKNKNLRKLCKMARAWKNKHGVVIGGLLIDTLAYNFLTSTTDYDDKGYSYYDCINRDFFEYLSKEIDKEYYLALGSRQRVKVKKKFQSKANKACGLCVEAITAQENEESQNDICKKWRDVFGKSFPLGPVLLESAAEKSAMWTDTEEFIEDIYPIKIMYEVQIDCTVSQNGFRDYSLIEMLRKHIPLRASKKLLFSITYCEVETPYEVKWKILNRGVEAERRNEIRGQIVSDKGYHQCEEHTNFKGNHLVECYIVKDNVVVARDSIKVPITTNM